MTNIENRAMPSSGEKLRAESARNGTQIKIMQSGTLRIGTSGIVLPGSKTTFPDEYQSGSRLHYYGSLFNTLEINSSFYKLPQPKTYEKWASEVPDNFEFTVKLWREITHAKKLIYDEENIDLFMQGANKLYGKKGCLLIQFPASITADYIEQLEKILQRIDYLNKHEQTNELKKWRLSVEFRHMSWYGLSTYEMLRKYNASLVVHDMPTSKTPIDSTAELDFLMESFAYIRFHGPTGKYNGSYEDEKLKLYDKYISKWLAAGKDVYIYFNNTMEGALDNAQFMQGFYGMTDPYSRLMQ